MILNFLKGFKTKRNLYSLISLGIAITILELINYFSPNSKFFNNVYFAVGFIVIFDTISELIINKILLGRFTLNSRNFKHK